MRAAVMRDGRLIATEVPDPVPGPGTVLAETIACGICGSDLHALKYGDQMKEVAAAAGYPADLDGDVVMGHEFSARVIELGPGASGLEVGDVVVSVPLVMAAEGMSQVGYSTRYPGGYGERMVLSPPFCVKVPAGVDPRHAALTEPMAVGVHAVAKARMQQGEGAVVVGCGPIGLAIIAGLHLAGAGPIVAADFSPRRRELAAHMGAHVVTDPAELTAADAWQQAAGTRTPVIFEAVGVPGMLDSIILWAPRGARVVVAGVCMEPDTIRPLIAIAKEVNVQFVLGYDPMEFQATLGYIADGRIDVAPLITGEVGIEEVPQAFETLGDPEKHAKILVLPQRA
jgi:2-desacetyl-2-hydroxyethyl bacteriochlorophyllide A dehydrogenase